MKVFALTLTLTLLATAAFAAPPQIVSYPTVNTSPLVANDNTLYSVVVRASDPDGYDDITCMRVLFDYTEAGGDSSKGRGYLAWGIDDATIARYGGTFVFGDATFAGGRWGYRTDAWGGTTYVTPFSCMMTTDGSATGSTGTRTATWIFRAKPAWAWNPLTNDCDVWVSDSSTNTGWIDNPLYFDVVSTPCARYTAAPGAPLVSNPTDNTVDITLAANESDTDYFSIKVSPAVDSKEYVQPDGTLSGTAVWQTKADWGSLTVTGLVSQTAFSFSLRAVEPPPGACPSGFGPDASITTTVQKHSIDASAPGKAMNRGVIGHATRLDYFPSHTRSWQKTWDVLNDTCVRGVAGGLDADTYNWKDMSGEGVGHTGTPGDNVPTTLSWMQLARDHNSLALLTANTRGIGPLDSSGWCTFYYTDKSIETVKQLAADWVKYVNFILPQYREGDALPPDDQAILDSIDWYGRPKLLSPGEAATPKVTYWEIGNEPEVSMPFCTPSQPGVPLTPSEYADRYKQISAAMLAVDPSIKLGPCITTARPNNAHLDAILDDPSIPVDFISYHPYGPLYYFAQDHDTTANAEAGLRYVKPLLYENYNGIIGRINASGRNPSQISLIASEYNPSDWHWECSPQIRRMSHALGVAETLLTYAEQGIFAANFWSHPSWCGDGTETPGYKVFKMAQELWGRRLIDSYSDGFNLRLYTTWNPSTRDIVIWGLNFSETTDKDVRFSLTNLGTVSKITQKRLANLSGPTSLFDTNDPPYTTPPKIDWTTTDITAATNPADFTITLPHATITLIVLHLGTTDAAQVKELADGSLVGLDSMIVTAAFDDYYYVETQDRTSGIRVYKPDNAVTEGMEISVSGVLHTNEHGEREILAY